MELKIEVEENFILPKYITPEIVETAIDFAYGAVLGDNENSLFPGEGRDPSSHSNCHIAVLIPTRNMADGPGPIYPIYYAVFGKSFGDPGQWKRPFDEIAKNKAYQILSGRSHGASSVIPHLLFPGEAPYWGGAAQESIAAACSGRPQHIDRLISEITISTIRALAYIAYESDPNHPGKNPKTDFI